MKIKDFMAVCAVVACFPFAAWPIPADPCPKHVFQPDGEGLTIIIKGDEHGYMLSTDDGIPLYYNSQTRAFEYAGLTGNTLTGSGINASGAANRDARALAYISSMDVRAVSDVAERVMCAGKGAVLRTKMHKVRTTNFPTTGNVGCLVVLMEFSGCDGSFTTPEPKQFFTAMLNEEGFTYPNGADGSVRDFYYASSCGRFEPEFDVAGPALLSESYAYYGHDDNSGAIDVNFHEAIVEACRAVDGEVDFSRYDTDGDGYVDNIYFYYSGYGQADTGRADYVWPHSYYLEQGYGITLELDGAKIDRYSCGNELRSGTNMPAGIGTFVHEFGHVLGLADHYATDSYVSSLGIDPGQWDTMASGSYNGNMHRPPLFSAYERAELGWLDYTDLGMSADTISVLPALDESNMAYRVAVPGDDDEYYVIENRRQRGWDAGLPGHGMLLWHIDADDRIWRQNVVNNDPDHQRVDIVEADGRAGMMSYDGDTFPGTSGVTGVTLHSWGGTSLMDIGYINEREDTIRILLNDVDFTLPAPGGLMAVDVDDDAFRLVWDDAADVTSYALEVSVADSHGDFSVLPEYDNLSITNTDTYDITGLEPATTYRVGLRACLAGYVSEPATIDIVTTNSVFGGDVPAGLKAADITPTGFTAVWDEMAGATDYLISLLQYEYASQTVSRGYDFDDRGEGMPDSWETTAGQYDSSFGWYVRSAPSLDMTRDGQYLSVEYEGTMIERLSMWCRSSAGRNKLRIDVNTPEGWTALSEVDVPVAGSVVEVPVGVMGSVRLVFECAGGYMAIDDVYAVCRDVTRSTVPEYDGLSTAGQTSFTFDGLDEGGIYAFTVRGTDGTEQSDDSAECVVRLDYITGLDGIRPSSSDGRAVIYDMQGRMMCGGVLPRGIYIIKQDGRPARKVVVR